MDAFLAERGGVISIKMTTMRMTTVVTKMRTTINNDDNKDDDDDKDVTMMTMILFFRQQPTLVGCIPSRGGGWVISTMMMTIMAKSMRTTISII